MKPMKQPKRIALGDEFSSTIVRVNGLEISVDKDGNALIRGEGDLRIATRGEVIAKGYELTSHEGDNLKMTARIEEVVEETEELLLAFPEDEFYYIGDELPDGWVVVGVSPDTKSVFSIEPYYNVSPDLQTWHTGENHAANLRNGGHNNARLPTQGELSHIYQNVVKPDRNHNARLSAGDYWSCAHRNTGHALLAQRVDLFRKAWQTEADCNAKNARIRCVRDEPSVKVL